MQYDQKALLAHFAFQSNFRYLISDTYTKKSKCTPKMLDLFQVVTDSSSVFLNRLLPQHGVYSQARMLNKACDLKK